MKIVMTFTVLAIMGGLISAAGTIPYIVETIKGKTKPRLVTWATWSALTGVAAAGAFSDGQISSGIFALLGSLATGSIVAAGLRYGDRSFSTIDIACLVAVAAGIALWLTSSNPSIAVWTAIAVDFAGFIPTLKHAWQKPHEETASTFMLVGVGGVITVAAVASAGAWSVTAIGYPLYVALSMAACSAVILARNKQRALPDSTQELASDE